MNRTTTANSYKVLIAEDNQVVSTALGKILNDINIDYTLVSSGEDLIEEYHKDYYDMLLVDILMPGMDGFDVSKKIRNINSTIPIIAFTCLSFPEVKKQMAESGINHYIGKPEDFDQLKELVEGYFNVAA